MASKRKKIDQKITSYNPSDFGDENLKKKFDLQFYEARRHFLNFLKPRYDKFYKLYYGYTGDRAKDIKKWQANVFVMYTHAVVETLIPRIVDARPEFTVKGRTQNDQDKSEKQQQLMDYDWEIAKMDRQNEDHVRTALILGTAFYQVYWKKDVRELDFLSTKDISKNKYEYKKKEKVFYDAPYAENVDPYEIWYDRHNSSRELKEYWFRRRVLSGNAIKRKYPFADPERLEIALCNAGGDLEDYTNIREEVKNTYSLATRNISGVNYGGSRTDKYNEPDDPDLRMYEVIEWVRPYDDKFSVVVGGSFVPILPGGEIPFPYDFKETPFIDTAYLRLPFEFEGVGVPEILENPQIMLNMIKNQRLDAATLNIHKMWIVNPQSNVSKDELVVRPFGIIYSQDPNAVREVQFGDVKSSAYQEEELLKSDMRYSSGVDDFSMGVGGGAGSATEVRHMRESTLERVRIFVNHLGDTYSDIMRYWMDMERQFFSEERTVRIIGDDGKLQFPLIEKDDLEGNFDYVATVNPAIAGQMDVKKKQAMDLFQLLITLPFIDQRKLTSLLLYDWGWNLSSIEMSEEGMEGAMGMDPNAMGMDPAMMAGGGDPNAMGMGPIPMPMDPQMMAMAGAAPAPAPSGPTTKSIPSEILSSVISSLRGSQDGGAMASNSAFSEAAMPINLMNNRGVPPPTTKGVGPAGTGTGGPGKTTNTRGFNRKLGGKVNTNINLNQNANPESSLMNRTFNIQS